MSGLHAGQPVFTPISHPELRTLSQANIHTFLRDRETYLLRLKDAANTTSGTLQPVSIKSSIKQDLIIALIDAGEFDNDVDNIDDLTEETLEKWLKEREVTLESLTLKQLEHVILSRVKLNANEPNARIRILRLVADYQTVLREKKWDHIIKDTPKVAVGHICELLQPPELTNTIENDLKLGKHELRKQWKQFVRYLIEQAEACESFVPIRTVQRRDQKMEKSDKNNDTTSGSSGKNRGHKNDDKTRHHKKPKEKKNKSEDEDDGDDEEPPKKRLPLCLNGNCRQEGRRHLIKDCKDTPEDEKQRLLDQHRKERRQANGRKPGLRLLNVDEPHHEDVVRDGIFKATLADTLMVDLNGDYGSDHAALSIDHIQELHTRGVFIPILNLADPIEFGVALDGEDLTFKAYKKARISTTISTAGGPLRLRNVQYLVVEEKMSHVLLSRPLLKELGFNLEHHLAQVRHRFNDADFSHIGFSAETFGTNRTPRVPSRLSRLLLQNKRTTTPTSPEHLEQTQGESDDSEAGGHQAPEQSDTSTPEISPSFYGENLDDDPSTSKYDADMEVGEDSEAEMKKLLSNMLQDAVNHGLPPMLQERLSLLLEEYKDIFRYKMGADPPLDVPPMIVELKPGAKPIRVKPRRYSPAQAEFLRKQIDEMLKLGLVRVNTRSKWASAPHVTPKDGPERFRFTVDLRPVNHQTEPYIWPMPDVEGTTAQLKEAKCFASIDLCHYYWQLPLHPDSQECQSFITPEGVYSPTRVLHGQTNATAHGQAAIQNLCVTLRDCMLQWLDDLLFHEKTPARLLDRLEEFFGICKEHNLKLHVLKCHLFLKEIKWCARVISAEGMRLDPRRFKALTEMEEPVTGAELQQFVCGANWMRTVIPEFNKKVHILAQFLEKVYNATGKRTKAAMSRVKLADHSWSATEQDAFNNMKQDLLHSVTLAHPHHDKLLCLFTDASELHWGAVLTQIPPPDKDLEFEEQRHQPLAFLSGSFTGSSFRWSTPEKEAFAIVEAVTKLNYIVLRPKGFMLFTDHKNLTYLFNPVAVQPSIAKHVANKLERWAMRLCHFKYEIVHIAGDENVWADLLSRWGAPQNPTQDTLPRLSTMLRAPVAPELNPDFDWPTAKDITAAQQQHFGNGQFTSLANIKHNRDADGIIVNEDAEVWIPDGSLKLQLRILVIGHCGRAGHRGIETTYKGIKDLFFWSTLQQDVATFVNTCLHCLSTVGGSKIPRPFGHTLHSDKPNDLIHFDFLYIGESDTGKEYALIVKDDASIYTWLEAYSNADAISACDLLLRWFAAFGVTPNWMSDQGPHFLNTLMTDINRSLHTNHHFTTPNHPQSNGTVESVCREVLRVMRALRSEYRLKEKEWPVLLPVIQSVLNHSTRRSLDGKAPITVFSGLSADNPLRTILSFIQEHPKRLQLAKCECARKPTSIT